MTIDYRINDGVPHLLCRSVGYRLHILICNVCCVAAQGQILDERWGAACEAEILVDSLNQI